MSVKRAKLAKYKWRDSVFGFIRRHAKAETLNIPILVQYLCLDFYWLDERFRVLIPNGSPLVLSQNGRHLSNQSLDTGVAIGNVFISADPEGVCEYKWTFEIPKCDGIKIADSPLVIGIVCKPESAEAGNVKKCIALHGGKVIKDCMDIANHIPDSMEDCQLEHHDGGNMTLDVNEKALHFGIYRGGTAMWSGSLENIPSEKGCYSVVFVGKRLSIKLTDFCIRHN